MRYRHWETCLCCGEGPRSSFPTGDRRRLGQAANASISDGYINSRIAKVDKD